jgi:nitronate monooxygenase
VLPQVVQAVKLPVIAAGGIADAQGVDAAMALGAAGAQVGTSYLLCPEATTTALHRAALQSPRAEHTVLTNLITGRPARGMRNRLLDALGPLSDAPPAFPLATAALAPLKAAAEKLGRDDFSTLWSGQNASGCRAIPAAEMTRRLAGL